MIIKQLAELRIMGNDDYYFNKRCASCKRKFLKAELHEPFEGIYYCEECMEKYKIPISKLELKEWNFNL